MPGARHFIGTWFPATTETFNPLDNQQIWNDLLNDEPWIKSWSAQVETSPTTQRRHVQFYIQTRARKPFSAVKALLPGCHVEAAAKPRDAWNYCQKEESRTGWSATYGDPPQPQGARNDLKRAAELMGTGDLRRVAEEMPDTYVRYDRGLRALSLHRQAGTLMQWSHVDVTVLWGPTGTGKTRAVAQLGDVFPLEVSDSGAIWFDGYIGQKHLLIDEFYGQIRPAFLLKLLDSYRRSWPVKGGYIVGTWSHVFITSNVAPDGWYGASVPESVKRAIARRIARDICVDEHTPALDLRSVVPSLQPAAPATPPTEPAADPEPVVESDSEPPPRRLRRLRRARAVVVDTPDEDDELHLSSYITLTRAPTSPDSPPGAE